MRRPIFIGLRVRILALLGAVLLIYLGTFAGGWKLFFGADIRKEVELVRSELELVASEAAQAISGDDHQRLMSAGKMGDELYIALTDKLLEAVAPHTIVAGVYTYTANPNDPRQIRWGVDSLYRTKLKSDDAGCSAKGDAAQLRSADEAISPNMLHGLREIASEETTYSDRWGEWISAYAPISDSSGKVVGAVGVDMCAVEVLELQDSVRRQLLIDLAATVLLLGGGLFLVMFRITRPIVALAAAASRVAHGDYADHARPRTRGRVRDELSLVWEAFDQMIAKVRTREESLRRQVTELQIVIDESKRRQEVTEITETDFFRELADRAEHLRNRRNTK